MCVMWRWIEVRCTILQCNFSKFPFKAKSKQTHKKYWHWQVPPRDNSILELEVFYHYFIRTNFKIRKFQCPDSRLECCYVDRSGDCRHTVHSTTSMWRRVEAPWFAVCNISRYVQNIFHQPEQSMLRIFAANQILNWNILETSIEHFQLIVCFINDN